MGPNNPFSGGPSSSGLCSLLISWCVSFSTKSSIPPLNICHVVNDILPRFSYLLPAHVVPCLGSSGCYSKWKYGGAHFLHRCRLYRYRNFLGWLGWHSPQQPWFPRVVHLPVVDLFRLPRHSRLHHLQEAHFQLGRKAQQAVVAETRRFRSPSNPESARVLRVLQSLRVGNSLPNVLREEHPSGLQGPLHEV